MYSSTMPTTSGVQRNTSLKECSPYFHGSQPLINSSTGSTKIQSIPSRKEKNSGGRYSMSTLLSPSMFQDLKNTVSLRGSGSSIYLKCHFTISNMVLLN